MGDATNLKTRNHIAAVGSTLGGFCLGTVIGWSSIAEIILKRDSHYNAVQLSWISSIMPIGAAVSQVTADGFWENFKTKSCTKALVTLLVMHAVQQLSGIHSIMFYAQRIFQMSDSKIPSQFCPLILRAVQFVFTCVSACLVDIIGRKVLWKVSLIIMSVCLFLMGIFFTIKRHDDEQANSISIMPVICIYIYLMGFALGTGPLAWMMISEFLPDSVKTYIGPAVACFNWLLAFAVTRSFSVLIDAVGPDSVFWGFAVICVLGLTFVSRYVIETHNKTLEEIQLELGS